MIEMFLIALALVGFVPALYLAWMLINMLVIEPNTPDPKFKSRPKFEPLDSAGFEEVRLPKRNK